MPTDPVPPVVRDYLLLGLRFGRLVDGFVDCWIGDPALERQVRYEPPPTATELVRQAREVAAAVPDSGLAPVRRRFLAAQLTALECAGRRLAGEEMPFRREIESYFQVRIAPRDPDWYAAAHAELDAELPGSGPLRDRLVEAHRRDRVPVDRLGGAVHAVAAALRAELAPRFPLPAGERVDFEVVTGRPWNAFNTYLGGLRSRVALNADVGHRITSLPFVATHEAYPGHHAEHCLKEAGLVRDRGWAEQSISLVNTPQCLIAEGMAEQAIHVALGERWGGWTAEVLSEVGLALDGARAQRVETAFGRLLAARQDAAIMLHDQGRPADEVAAFLARWMLVSDERAGQMLRFLTDPLWRAYTTTYIEGSRLVRHWLDAGGPGDPATDRYHRLLVEPMLPADLAVDLPAPAVAQPTPAVAQSSRPTPA
ncbi:DUF885 domain-containing protein [Micromonospora sp. WMMD975]|uniref:DUF885 domain-containing protein n=1 Tax=Micromonospora sp. WMMD975 TaxID=3016087 RepID=UPI00249C7EFB|nr:DUF885 domain-containing protein [Micromonospora sp. WMMD975]WFE36405.1 DUF885 domain-containing protein [Micromonospora sp. WMMD975]